MACLPIKLLVPYLDNQIHSLLVCYIVHLGQCLERETHDENVRVPLIIQNSEPIKDRDNHQLKNWRLERKPVTMGSSEGLESFTSQHVFPLSQTAIKMSIHPG